LFTALNLLPSIRRQAEGQQIRQINPFACQVRGP